MTSISGIKRSLEDRAILCADCDATRRLSLSISGNLVCSICGSDNWMYLPMTANVKETVSIRGDLTADEDLTIEGRVEGKIELKEHNLWIGPHGDVRADIHAKSVMIAGNLVGHVYATDLVEIKLSGSVQGKIKCKRLSIVDGARFEGTIDTGTRVITPARPDSVRAESATMSRGSSR